jgi:hypothetical protein
MSPTWAQAPPYIAACADQTGQNGNISADPNFATNANTPHPYQLQLSSPAIDNGDTARLFSLSWTFSASHALKMGKG